MRNALDQITRKSIQTLASMNQHSDYYVKTASELYKKPREDKKIISKLAKEVFVEWGDEYYGKIREYPIYGTKIPQK